MEASERESITDFNKIGQLNAQAHTRTQWKNPYTISLIYFNQESLKLMECIRKYILTVNVTAIEATIEVKEVGKKSIRIGFQVVKRNERRKEQKITN